MYVGKYTAGEKEYHAKAAKKTTANWTDNNHKAPTGKLKGVYIDTLGLQNGPGYVSPHSLREKKTD